MEWRESRRGFIPDRDVTKAAAEMVQESMGSSFLIICSIHLICSSLILNVNDLRDLCHCQSKRRSSQTHTKVQLESGTESLCFLWLAPSFLPTWALRLLSGDLEARTRFALRHLTEERHHVSFLIFDFCRSEV